jgi:tetratricopeptide (TPR) repeat protein
MTRRPLLPALTLVALTLVAPAASAQDWDAPPTRPTRPARPVRPTRPQPARPTRPQPTRPAPVAQPAPPPPATGPASDAERNRRMIEHLLAVLLRGTDENAVALPTLLRLVRERDGNLTALTADLEQRAAAPGADALGAHLLLGHIQRQNGRLDEAVTRYRRAAELAPTSPVPLLALADTLRQMDRGPDALTTYERALALNLPADRRHDVLRALLDLSLAVGDVPRARTWHQRLVAASPASASVRRELADALVTRRLFSDAITEFQALTRALAGDNRVLPPVLRDLGRAQMQVGQLDDALVTFRRALALAGAGTGVRRELLDDLTELHTRRHDLDAWVTELAQQGGASWERLMLLGRLHAEQGRSEQAIAAYRRAAALRPGDIDALVQLVQLLAQSARFDELIAARRRLAAAAPRNPAYVTDLADDLVRAGRRAEALAALAQASARAGADVDMHERLAQTYARLGEQAAALRETELVARYDPSDPAALEALGERQMEAGDRDRAMATWQRIRDHARDRARGAAALAEVYARHDLGPQALTLYREAIAARPDELDYHKGLAVVAEALRLFDPAIAARPARASSTSGASRAASASASPPWSAPSPPRRPTSKPAATSQKPTPARAASTTPSACCRASSRPSPETSPPSRCSNGCAPSAATSRAPSRCCGGSSRPTPATPATGTSASRPTPSRSTATPRRWRAPPAPSSSTPTTPTATSGSANSTVRATTWGRRRRRSAGRWRSTTVSSPPTSSSPTSTSRGTSRARPSSSSAR